MKTNLIRGTALLLIPLAFHACYHSGAAYHPNTAPIIREVPEEEILSEEEPEFVDLSISESEHIGDHNLEVAPPPPPPPPPPMEAKPNLAGNWEDPEPEMNTEDYTQLPENDFQEVLNRPLSTFSVDVDRASYANVRRFLNSGQWPAPGSVRLEEMINYFNYDYPTPTHEVPFSVDTELTDCPWNDQHKLLRIGLKGREIPTAQIPASNLVFLLDVSGSMQAYNKLPLLKIAFTLLTQQMRPEDRVAIVVYAGASGLVLPSTPGDQKITILDALEGLSAGGSTAGAAGIQLAYQTARENFIPGGNNRVILATDGDFNVGNSSDAALVQMIEKEREDDIFLSILGFGMGNYKDNKMEQLADSGNGNYAYIDNVNEARKVLVNEFGGTLFTIAKDVKLQLEFNPAHVRSYRLLGYENRILADKDFNDDTKDAGEIGAGHTVTALYELIPAGLPSPTASVDELEFQDSRIKPEAGNNPNWISLKLRYKNPNEDTSQLLKFYAQDADRSFSKASENTRFATAVAGFGMLLRHSKYSGDLDFDQVLEMAEKAKGKDKEGYRTEFLELVKKAQRLAR